VAGGAGGQPGRIADSARTLARLLPDFGPAREHPAFRRLLAGGLLSNLGGSMTSFAVVLQVWDISRSSLAVGLLGLTFVPVLVVGSPAWSTSSAPAAPRWATSSPARSPRYSRRASARSAAASAAWPSPR